MAGETRQGLTRTGKAGTDSLGFEWHGSARQAWRSLATLDKAREAGVECLGMAVQGLAGQATYGVARMAAQGSTGQARSGRPGGARSYEAGGARLGRLGRLRLGTATKNNPGFVTDCNGEAHRGYFVDTPQCCRLHKCR